MLNKENFLIPKISALKELGGQPFNNPIDLLLTFRHNIFLAKNYYLWKKKSKYYWFINLKFPYISIQSYLSKGGKNSLNMTMTSSLLKKNKLLQRDSIS